MQLRAHSCSALKPRDLTTDQQRVTALAACLSSSAANWCRCSFLRCPKQHGNILATKKSGRAQNKFGVTTCEPALETLTLGMIKSARLTFWQSESPERRVKPRAERHLFDVIWKSRAFLLDPLSYFQNKSCDSGVFSTTRWRQRAVFGVYYLKNLNALILNYLTLLTYCLMSLSRTLNSASLSLFVGDLSIHNVTWTWCVVVGEMSQQLTWMDRHIF